MITILFVGDIVAEPGMRMFEKAIPSLKNEFNPNLIVVNGENTRNGKGMSEGLAKKYFDLGVDCITSGNHIWDYSKFHGTLNNSRFANILRPLNYPEGVPGEGYTIIKDNLGRKVGIINIQGRTFMQPIDCPFNRIVDVVEKIRKETNVIFVDFHAETTAEKISMGWWLDGKVSALVGTHTHVQTADERIFDNGTAFICDAGMTGSFDSVIGMKKEIALNRFRFQTPFRYEFSSGDLKINGVVVEIDDSTGKAKKITRIYRDEKEFI
ncbi:MAG: TIGR00282 family metallophosphoesterase [Candidatus Cloacimonadota bacterium]|nr:MAG: TIGR00282 family metallophosphoesterase [Candidatus Cloacimonadota bacterium]PIE78692.1 MAG: TIGR00282 family metallophosphoesterase [Candidatus Delongbacteria bacterium]